MSEDKDKKDKERKDQDLSEVPSAVERKLREGNVVQAKRQLTASSESWRDSLPRLPIRFPVTLVRLQIAPSTELLRRSARSRSRPPLKLLKGEESGIKVVTSRGQTLEIGYLPQGEADMLLDIDPHLRVFKPRLLDISRSEDGVVQSVSIELVRRETHRCPECGREHSGTHQLCKRCRRSRKPKADKSFGETPVPVTEALDAILSESGDEDLPV